MRLPNVIAAVLSLAPLSVALAPPAFVAVAIVATSEVTSAQIRSGYYSDGNGGVASVNITETPEGTAVTVVDETGHTPPTQGFHDDNGNVVAFNPIETNSPTGNRYRGRLGKVQKWNGTAWVNQRRIYNHRGGCPGVPPGGGGYGSKLQDVFRSANPAPFTGSWQGEITSLPLCGFLDYDPAAY